MSLVKSDSLAVWHSLSEEQRAQLIWQRPAVVVVKCVARNARRCTLGKVALTPNGHLLAVPPFRIRTEDFYEGRPVDPDDQPATRPWVTFPVDDVEAGNIPVRCKHHTWTISPSGLLKAVERAKRDGRTEVYLVNWSGQPGWPDVRPPGS